MAVWIPSYERTIENLNDLNGRNAEKQVAEALRQLTSPDVWILHSLRYSLPRPNRAAVNLEIDFLIVWKHKGIMILEVKGGRIDYDSEEDQWWSTSRHQVRKKLSRSPVKQVEGQKNDLCSEILREFMLESQNARNIVERVLVFPDINLRDLHNQQGQRVHRIDDFEVDWIVDQTTLVSLASFIEAKLEPCASYIQQSGVHSQLFEDIVIRLRPSATAEIRPRHILENTESKIEELTNEQKEHLSHVLEAKRLLVDGPAGSAKTILGLSAVLSWAESGVSAFYITASEYLVSGLQKDVRYSQIKNRIMTIRDFLQVEFDTKIENSEEAMLSALMEWEFPSRTYNLVIDEAQDLSTDLYEAIVSLLPCERLWIMKDHRQCLKRANDSRDYNLGTMAQATPYHLTENCRNARPIAERVAKYIELPDDYVSNRLPLYDSSPEDFVVTSTDEQDQRLIEILKRAQKEGWDTKDITVISCDINGRDAVCRKYCSLECAKIFRDIFSYAGKDENKISIYHFLDFKGLESAFVLVTDFQDQESVFRANYLAGSRAKCHLALIRIEDSAVAQARVSDIPDGLTFD